jgi:Tol biopolymer transport system component
MRTIAPILLALALVACANPPARPGESGTTLAEVAVTQETFGPDGEDRDPELGPHGRWIYFASSTYAEHYDIYRKGPKSSVVTRITMQDSDERFPKVNPKDPNIVAFCSNVNGEWDVFVIMDVEKQRNVWVRVSEPGSQDIHPSWSPDGTKIVYASGVGGSDAVWYLKVVDVTTGTVHLLPQVDGLLPEWSPVEGDDRIVFQRMRHRGNWFGSIWTLRFRGGEVSDLTYIYGDGDWAAINPSWSNDGTHIVFATVAKSKVREGKTDEPDDLWVVSAKGTRPMQLTTHPSADGMPEWGSDDRIYFLSWRSGRARVWSGDAPFHDAAEGGETSGRVLLK